MTIIAKHFKPSELVPKSVYDSLKGDPTAIFRLFDDRFIITIDLLQERYGTMFINNWAAGGNLSDCGLRLPDSKTGANWSQHKFGRAGDLHPTKVTAQEMRNDCLANPFLPEFKYITCIEDAVSWFHMDTRNWDKTKNGVLIVKP